MKNLIAVLVGGATVIGLASFGAFILAQEADPTGPPDEFPANEHANVPPQAIEHFDHAQANAAEAQARANARFVLIGEDLPHFPFSISNVDFGFTTKSLLPLPALGMTADPSGNLYVVGQSGSATLYSPIWRIDRATGDRTLVGEVLGSVQRGMTFGPDGMIYVASGGKVFRITPKDDAATVLNRVDTPYASLPTGVGGPGGMAFDSSGRLWACEGVAGHQGRVYLITPDPADSNKGITTEKFRVPPLRNTAKLGGKILTTIFADGVGRQQRNFPPGALTDNPATPTVNEATAGGNDLAAASIAFGPDGHMYISDAARGAIWKAKFDSAGNMISPVGHDTTYAANALDLDNIFVQHPSLTGDAGFVIDASGNIWAVSERNAMIFVSANGKKVIELFRNPVNSAGLRNGFGTPTSPDPRDAHILEGPLAVVLIGHELYVSSADIGATNLGDNAPNTNGETSPNTRKNNNLPIETTLPINGGKVSRLDQEILVLPNPPVPEEVAPLPSPADGNVTFTTVALMGMASFGLTADAAGNLYTSGRFSVRSIDPKPTPPTEGFPIYRIDPAATDPATAATIVARIKDSNTTVFNQLTLGGLAFGPDGLLYVAAAYTLAKGVSDPYPGGFVDPVSKITSNGLIYKFIPSSDPDHPTLVTTPFATGLPLNQSMAFDPSGNLWTSDVNLGHGRIYMIDPNTGSSHVAFRIPPMRNTEKLGGKIPTATFADGVGRQMRRFPPGTLANTQGGSDLVAFIIRFGPDGSMYISDAARAAIWKVKVDANGNVISPTGCDTTLEGPGSAPVLCMSNIFVSHPALPGSYLTFDQAGNIWASASERNGFVFISADGKTVKEVYRNEPSKSDKLRCGFVSPADGTPEEVAEKNKHILEFPASNVIVGHTLYVTSLELDANDNSSSARGEVGPDTAHPLKGKISKMDLPLQIEGL